ncbi:MULTISPECIES: hypothetical protein [Citrobacter freundii complex]|uniref:hypothetical protein n=1 Tax=Citrobacter freundii complex TaxID=1344959 RepID=UPI000D5A03A6|nr:MULTISPECIES: hypothetical protein [Citrobacter freundii complex]MEB2304766.1 hypothetical protein [Citrobacter braakii]WBG09918.1 hypothetical protein O9240_12485 [Citrobacter freundii]WFY37789.1 hypothetical protein NFK30_09775 [Citrobacter braakii]
MADNRTVMPQTYSQADAEWIQKQLITLAPSARQKAIERYSTVYQESFEAEPVSYRKENRARHEANMRLRLFVRNHGRALQGYTAEPPLAGTPPRS